MSKVLKNAAPLAVVAALVLGVGVAFAQEEPPQPPYGRGLMAGYEDVIHQALADALGITLGDFEAARADGQTLAELAEAHDVELSELFEVMDAARAEAISRAVADGVITQEQADWMVRRQGARGGVGNCAGIGAGPTIQGSMEGRGMMGRR